MYCQPMLPLLSCINYTGPVTNLKQQSSHLLNGIRIGCPCYLGETCIENIWGSPSHNNQTRKRKGI